MTQRDELHYAVDQVLAELSLSDRDASDFSSQEKLALVLKVLKKKKRERLLFLAFTWVLMVAALVWTRGAGC